MKKYLYISALLLFIQWSGQAQREMTWWYFGINTGLDFTKVLNGKATVPTKISGPIFTVEGCFTLSDQLGNFLMASDGSTVYNKNKAVMENGTGLNGHPSAAQSGIIIPRPQHPNEYYIVTVPYWGASSDGICYSIADLNENNGLGKITTKNVQLNLGGTSGLSRSDCAENITATQHANGRDYWLVHRAIQGYFFTWLVTEDGIAADPASITKYGHNHTDAMYKPGNIKFSPDGTKLVHIGWFGMTVGTFNNATGKVTGIHDKVEADYAYSGEFSPNGKYYYFCHNRAGAGIYRMSMEDFQNTLLDPNTYTSAMQIGPDKKIYAFDRRYKEKLSLWTINNPDAGGTDRTLHSPFFNEGDIYNAAFSEPVWNFCTFANSTFSLVENIVVSPTYICQSASNDYTVNAFISGQVTVNHLEWNFGDGTAVVNDTDFSGNTQTHAHTYAKGGSYTITITPYEDAGKTKPVTASIVKKTIRVATCRLPVNHNYTNVGN